MSYLVYTNKNNPHSTIHSNKNCKEIKKNGGEHKYDQGYYSKSFETFEEAKCYAKERINDNKNNINICSYCSK